MIFRTIKDETTGAIHNVNILSQGIRKLKEIGIKNIFASKGEIDLDWVDRYNQAIQTTADKQSIIAQYTQNTNRATADLIKSAKGTVVSETAKQAALNATTFAAKASEIALKGVAIAANIGLGILLTWGLPKLIEFVDGLHDSLGELNEKIEENRQAYEDATSEIERLNSELETTREQIEELNRLDKLSVS